MSKKAKVQQQEEAPPVQVFDPTFMVQLESSDGHVFFCDRNVAKISKLVKATLNEERMQGLVDTGEACQLVRPATADGQLACVKFPFLPGAKLEKALQSMHYKYKYDNEAPDHRPAAPFVGGGQSTEMLLISVLLQM